MITEQTEHPELKPGEVFFTNLSCEDDWEEIGWLSKRLGKTAYDVNGNIIPGLRPVFVWKSELERAGIGV